MGHTESPPQNPPWSKLIRLLRKGSAAIDSELDSGITTTGILQEGNRLFEAMVDAFDGMIYICSIDYRVEFMNDRMIEHVGHDATGELCYEAFGRKNACPWCINHRILKGETVRWEVISPIDGRWYYVVNAPIRHMDGKVSKYAMMMDIHDRKKNEEALKRHGDHLEEAVKARTAELTYINTQLRLEIEDRKEIVKTLQESQERYRNLFEGSRDAILICNAKGRILDANDAASQLTGYSKSELIYSLAQDLNEDLDQATFEAYFDRILSGEIFTSEATFHHKDGSEIHAEFSSKQFTLAGIPCIHTTARDITQRNKAEEALRLSEAKYRELVQNANSLIVRLDTHARVTFFNEFAQAFFGYEEKEILGRKIIDTVLPPIDSTGRDLEADLKDLYIHPEKFKNIALENVRRNGERVVVAWTNRPVRGVDGKIIEFLCVGVDITERRRQRQRIQTLTHELLKAQETERYKIARDLHDHIAQDLSSLKIGMQTLFAGEPFNDPSIQEQAQTLNQILARSISEVRNLAYDLRPPGLDQFGLVRTLFTYCEDFAQKDHFKVDFKAAGLDDLHLDDDIQINLYRLIQEALYNVKKHAHAKGVTIRLVASSPKLMLRIIDDGQGFDVKQWRTKYHRKKRMGLTSMKERVGLLNGSIEIRSQPGKGTAIFITIPIKEQPRDHENPRADH